MTDGRPLACDHDGDELVGMVLEPAPCGDGEPTHGTVMMFPGATGPGPSFLKAARELAAFGYRVVIADMYGSGADLSTPEAAGRHYAALLEAPETLRARVLAWFECTLALAGTDPDRIAAIGYCFGGKCVLELARAGARLASVTSFHGLLGTHAPAHAGAVLAHVSVWSGGRDPYAPLAQFDALRAELDAAGADYQATLFAHAEHAFTDPDHHGYADGIAYDAAAHAIAWAGTLARLQASLGAQSREALLPIGHKAQ